MTTVLSNNKNSLLTIGRYSLNKRFENLKTNDYILFTFQKLNNV